MFIVRTKGNKEYFHTKKDVINYLKSLKKDEVFSVWKDVTDEFYFKLTGVRG